MIFLFSASLPGGWFRRADKPSLRLIKHLLLIVALLTSCLLAPLPARASYLEETQDAPPPRHIVPPPRPVPDNPLTDLILRVTIEPAYTFKGLTVFPLTVPNVTDSANYLSLDEALLDRTLLIEEKDDATVPVLVAENRGKRFILLLAGQRSAVAASAAVTLSAVSTTRRRRSVDAGGAGGILRAR